MSKTWFISLFAIILAVIFLIFINPLQWKQQAGLQVTTEGIASSLFLDGQYLDKTPFIDKKIKPGTYALRIQPDNTQYVPYELSVRLNKGMVTVVTWRPAESLEHSGGVVYEMEKLKDAGQTQLEFQTIPSGAILTVDQGTKQFSPLLLTDVSDGAHEFEVSLPSYETQQHSVHVARGHKVAVTVVLGKADPAQETEASAATQTEPVLSPTFEGEGVEILSTNFFVNDREVLRVRDTASAGGRELGFAPVGEFYPYLGETPGWLQIEFSGQPGWVSSQFSRKTASESTQPAQ
jgi:hypothetical protein